MSFVMGKIINVEKLILMSKNRTLMTQIDYDFSQI